MPSFRIERTFKDRIVAGVDEAGRGPWAGPVVAAAVIIHPKFCPKGINDSKQLDRAKREELFAELINVCDFGVGIVEEEIIDEVNILNATMLAMQRAVGHLVRKPHVVIVDGNRKFDAGSLEVHAHVKGDSKSMSIAAASIIAKVTRDRIMAKLHDTYPNYNWHSNSGYGTKCHIEALHKHGVTPHHRRSYAPVKAMLDKVANG